MEVKFGATHAKGYRIDQTVISGSHNNTIQSLRFNNETSLKLNDSKIAEAFKRYFANLWNGEERSPTVTEGDSQFVKLLTDQAYKRHLIDLIDRAEQTLDLAIYYFSERDIENAIVRAAQRGVIVRLYLNTHDRFATHLVKRNKETASRLTAAGVEQVYFDLPTFFSHSKYAIADKQTLLLGTGNWNYSDIFVHSQIYFEVKDSALAAQLSSHLDDQIANESSNN